MNNKIFSNNQYRKDFLGWTFDEVRNVSEVFIAVAFFTKYQFVESLLKGGSTVRLIVRLDFPTDPYALKKLLDYNNIYIRYFTSKSFHPKLYIFQGKAAFLGSSNLTDGGLMSNQELNISIDNEDPIYDELEEIFFEYWDQSVPLTEEKLKQYEKLQQKYAQLRKQIDNFNDEIEREIGRVEFKNINRPDRERTKNKKNVQAENMLRRYQIFLKEFDRLKKLYSSFGKRKDRNLPLRIEIDQFLSWIRENKATGEEYKNTHVRREEELKTFVLENIHEFFDTDYEFIKKISEKYYPIISTSFGSPEKVDILNDQEIVKVVSLIHAFHASAHYLGGIDIASQKFISDNGVEKIKRTFKYLLFDDKDDFATRIVNCSIESTKYKLKHFGESSVQELFGWANDKDVPICNKRTIKSMQWLGYNVS